MALHLLGLGVWVLCELACSSKPALPAVPTLRNVAPSTCCQSACWFFSFRFQASSSCDFPPALLSTPSSKGGGQAEDSKQGDRFKDWQMMATCLSLVWAHSHLS